MKNGNFNCQSFKLTVISLLTVGFFFFGFAILNAQTTSDYYNLAGVNFVSTSTALTRVDAKILEINTQLGTLNAQSQEYLYTSIKRDFYTKIHDELNAGKSVRESAESGIKLLITGIVPTQLPKVNRASDKQEAIELLRA